MGLKKPKSANRTLRLSAYLEILDLYVERVMTPQSTCPSGVASVVKKKKIDSDTRSPEQ